MICLQQNVSWGDWRKYLSSMILSDQQFGTFKGAICLEVIAVLGQLCSVVIT